MHKFQKKVENSKKKTNKKKLLEMKKNNQKFKVRSNIEKYYNTELLQNWPSIIDVIFWTITKIK